jgi:hypothetical protein
MLIGLIDSGADTTLVNMEYAKALGISVDSTNKKEFMGIGDSHITCFLGSVTMKIKHFDTPVTMSVAFIDSPSVDILLGQDNFFECFRIKFEKDRGVFELSLPPKKN